MDTVQLILATGNAGKVREIGEIVSGLPITLTSLKDHFSPVPDIPEDGSTFAENALIKARWVRNRKNTWVLADDSGLEVDALGGAPGVQSARYAGAHATNEQRIAKLLAALADVPSEKRTARFRCAMVLIDSDNKEFVCQGACEGRIIFNTQGTGGFGYDPVFIPTGYDQTFAQLDASVKNAISHRGKALHDIKQIIANRFK